MCALSSSAGTFGSGLGPNAAYVFVRDGERWVERQKLVPWDGDLGGRFGARVAVSTDGGVVAVGASLNGAIYVFERDGDAWAGRRRFDTGTRVSGLAAASGVVAATDCISSERASAAPSENSTPPDANAAAPKASTPAALRAFELNNLRFAETCPST